MGPSDRADACAPGSAPACASPGLDPRGGMPANAPESEKKVYKAIADALPPGWYAWHSVKIRSEDGQDNDLVLVRGGAGTGKRLWVFMDESQAFWEKRTLPRPLLRKCVRLKTTGAAKSARSSAFISLSCLKLRGYQTGIFAGISVPLGPSSPALTSRRPDFQVATDLLC